MILNGINMGLNDLKLNCIAKAELNNVFFSVDMNFNYGQGSACNIYLLPAEICILPKSNIFWDTVKFKKRDYGDPISLHFEKIVSIRDNIESTALSATYSILIKTIQDKLYIIKQFKMGPFSKERVNLDEFYFSLSSMFNDKISDKKLELLKRINTKVDNIKSDTELIKEFTSSIEDILDKFDDMENYLKDRLASDWEKIRNSWTEYKIGEIGKRELIKRGIKGLGKKFIFVMLSRPQILN